MFLSQELTRSYNYFMEKGYLHLYSLIFSSQQFPLFFTAEVIWSIYVVYQNHSKKEKNTKNILLGLVQAFLMVFLPRELAAIFLHRKSTILSNLKQLPIFAGVFVAFYFSPRDLIPKIMKYFEYFFGFLLGLNHVRFFNLIFRNSAKYDPLIRLIAAYLFSTSDIWIEIIFRTIFKFKRTQTSNYLILVIYLIAYTTFFVLTQYYSYSIYIPYICVSIVIGSLHGAPCFSTSL